MSKAKTDNTNLAKEDNITSGGPDTTKFVGGEGTTVDQGAAKSDTTTALTTASANAPAVSKVQPMPEKDIFEVYGDEINPRNIVGSLLKFSKGDWTAGQENTDKFGAKMIAFMDQLMLGWIRWEDQKPVDTRMGLLIEGFQAPPRDTLGYGYEPGIAEPDTSGWEVDATSKEPRDPWQFTYYLVMKDPDIHDDGEGFYTFTTSSSGGKSCIGDLCKIYGRKRREGFKDQYPVVVLKVGSYQHSNKQIGKIKVPALPVVGFVPIKEMVALPAPRDATEELATANDKEIPF